MEFKNGFLNKNSTKVDQSKYKMCDVGKVSFPTPTSEYWLKAQETHNFIVENMLTRYNSYRVNTTDQTNIAYEWYNVSQIYADAAMIQAGDTRCEYRWNWEWR